MLRDEVTRYGIEAGVDEKEGRFAECFAGHDQVVSDAWSP